MRKRCTGLGFVILGLAAAAPVSADVLTLACKTNRQTAYRVTYDPEKQALIRQDGTLTQTYRILRTQIEKNGDALVWGVTRERGTDMLAFFGSRTQVKYFYGNGAETTDSCSQD